MKKPIKTAVFPVAGMGTRFLPATKSAPKEMLPIIDKPLIHYVVEEAIQAGMTQLVFVTSHTKRAIEDYFDNNFELESRLAQAGKTDVLEMIKSIVPPHVDIVYIRQSEPRGLGDAVMCARQVVGDEPFAVLLADDVLVSSELSCLQSMLSIYHESESTVLAVENIDVQYSDQYGIVSVDDMQARPLIANAIIEKPKPAVAPSTLGVIGRYILNPSIFQCLEQLDPGVGGELQLTDAIAAQMKNETVCVYPFSGQRYDCGHHLGFIKATIDFALKDPRFSADISSYLNDRLENHKDSKNPTEAVVV